ncbi:MAG: hypothetical protein KAX38_05120, partial [Candidatus Krumholzibacteria bacterium]|nr:hypothetical protein [Candidatus Krumholzibacteria bacterium]
VYLGPEGALPGQTTTSLVFPSEVVPGSISRGFYHLLIELVGTENGASFDTALVSTDSVHVVSPSRLEYVAGSLAPSTVSKRSSVTFELGVNNAGGAEVVCNPDSTWLTFSDGLTEYLARLDGNRGLILYSGYNDLYFKSVEIHESMQTGNYLSSLRIAGSENGLPFDTLLYPVDTITVQEPSQLAINRITVSQDRITQDQKSSWYALINVQNNGEATVRLDSLDVRLFNGSVEVSNECVLNFINFNPHVDELGGGQQKNLQVQFNDRIANMMNAGTVIVEAKVWGMDLNSHSTLVATTESGGKGSYLVQTPADPVVSGIAASVEKATVLQTRDWTVNVVLSNEGESDIDLDLAQDSTFITFSTLNDFLLIRPDTLAGGGTILEGKSNDTLRFVIDRTGSQPGLCTINAVVRGTEVNSGKRLPPVSGLSGVVSEVLIQDPAVLSIIGLTALQDPVTILQGCEWAIEMTVENSGESALILKPERIDSTWVGIPKGSGFVIENPVEMVGGGVKLGEGESGVLEFTVKTTGDIEPGRQVITGLVLGEEENSGRSVWAGVDTLASTDSVTFEFAPYPRYVTGTLKPTVVSSGTGISIELGIMSDSKDQATLILDREKTKVSFGDAGGDTFRTSLSPVSEVELAGGTSTTLRFATSMVDTAIGRDSYCVGVHLEGTENGNPFETDISSSPDTLTVEEAPQLSIIGIETPSTVTISQQKDWDVRMVLQNNGEASVAIKFDPLKTNISFSIVGKGDRTGEYDITYPGSLSMAGNDTLGTGLVDTLVFAITTTGST